MFNLMLNAKNVCECVNMFNLMLNEILCDKYFFIIYYIFDRFIINQIQPLNSQCF